MRVSELETYLIIENDVVNVVLIDVEMMVEVEFLTTLMGVTDFTPLPSAVSSGSKISPPSSVFKVDASSSGVKGEVSRRGFSHRNIPPDPII